jgi:TolB-like protein/DNA-binding winged helix-turn-helix (wHTH) protein
MESERNFRYIAFDAVEIDLVSRRVTVADVETALEPKAFDVLALLARTPDKVFSRDEILDAVWGHRHVTPSVLNRAILLIRHALGDSARGLHTLRGIGYRFGGEVRFFSQQEKTSAITPVAGDATRTDAPAQGADEPSEVPAASVQWAAPMASTESLPLHAGDRAPPRKPAYATFLMLLAVFASTGWMLWAQRPSAHVADTAPASVKERGIAVLPLVNAGGHADQQFFSDGISENLITMLSQLEGLRVIGRGSSFRFRDGNEDGKAIGAKLGVAHLIEGSVQRVGDNLRIGIELVRSADGSTVWTQRFDRPYKDLFALQDEITLAVASVLQVKLLHSMAGAVETGRPASGNLEAYTAFLQGANYMWGGQNFNKAIDQLTQATRLDPAYVQAWQWMAYAHTHHSQGLTGDARRTACAQARREIETAVKLAPDYGLAYAGLGDTLDLCDLDWDGALAAFRKGIPLVSDSSPAHGCYSILLATLGRVNEAIEERRRHILGDPLASYAYAILAQLQASTGKLDAAEASARKAIEVRPEDTNWAVEVLVELAILRGDAATALAEATRMSPGLWRDRYLTLALQLGNDRAAADTALRRLIETDGDSMDAGYIARVYALRGDAGAMFEWLERGWERRDNSVHGVLNDPLLLRFRDDPRFAEYCRNAALPPPSESEALSIDQIRAANAAKR